MTKPEDRVTQLDWIRDGMKWVVSISGGLLGLSATYFYDRFDKNPRLLWLLYIAWLLLTISSLAGIFCALSAWKNIGRSLFGSWIRGSYTVAMWSFTLAFPALAIVLLANVTSISKGGSTSWIFRVSEEMIPFEPASASMNDVRFLVKACRIRRVLSDSGATSAIVVGRFDRRKISEKARATFGTNVELAQRRADQIGTLLTAPTLCKDPFLRSVMTLVGGPRLDLRIGATGAEADTLLAADRQVEIYGFRVR